MCQYLASEVHKPLRAAEAGQGAAAQKKVYTPKKQNVVPAPPPSKPVTPAVPPPAPLVSQVMEMGFSRRHVEYAVQVQPYSPVRSDPPSSSPYISLVHTQMTRQTSNVERIVDWLVSHAGLEAPELDLPSAPEPVPQPQATTVIASVSSPRPEADDEDSESSGSDVSDDLDSGEATPATGMQCSIRYECVYWTCLL